jgi:S-adenosylmethionine hydrolase
VQIVSLTSDFGTTDYYAGELKGRILQHLPTAQVIDISHDVAPFDIVQGAMYLSNTYNKFPRGTIHVAAVQNFYTTHNELIAFEREGYFFIGPNNGIFSLIWNDVLVQSIHVVSPITEKTQTLPESIAHAAAYLAHGLPLNEIGPIVGQFNKKMSIQPVVTNNQIRATIIHIDRFDNAIVNLHKDAFNILSNGRNFKIYFKHDDPIYHICQHYAEVPVGDALALWNTAGYLEIAVNMGKASTLYNLNKNETIQIYFID